MTDRSAEPPDSTPGKDPPDAEPSSLSRRLQERFGENIDPGLTLGEAPEEDRSGEHTISSDGESGSASASASSARRLQGLASRTFAGDRYRLEGEVARGGMGAILRVWDGDLRRPLAMKVVLGEESAEGGGTEYAPRRLERFLEEAQITAQLDHPGIVPVHELGLDDAGRVYFTMKMVKGGDLREVFERHRAGDPRWSLTRCLSLVIKVCDALSYAHDKGVVHRDVKPANVMVGRYGEVYLMDWGLAKVQGRPERAPVARQDSAAQTLVRTDRVDGEESGSSSAGFTMDGSAIGTPYYMPPEQAAGQLDRIGPQSDVYAVGALLYELFAGLPPYQVEGGHLDAATVLALVIHGPPPPVAEKARGVSPELIAICEKAMARDPAARYETIGGLAEDLRNYIEGKVVKAHATGAIVEFRKWVQRNRSIAAGLAAAVLLAIGGAWRIAAVESQRATLAEEAEESERTRARQLAELNGTLGRTNEALGRAKDTLQERNDELDSLNQTLQDRNDLLARTNSQLEGARLSLVSSNMDLETERNLLRESQQEAERAREAAEAAARQAEEERDAADRVIDFVVALFKDVDPYAQGEDALSARDLLEQGIQDATGTFGEDALLRARVLDTLGGALFNLAEWQRAAPLYEEAHAIRLEKLGRTDPLRLDTANLLARVWSELGRAADAEALYRDVMAAREESLGPDDPQTLATLNNLAAHLANEGRLKEAGPMLETCLEIRRATLGELDESTLHSLNNLGMNHYLCRRYERAETVLREALAKRREVLGDDHRDVLHSQYCLARCLSKLGRTAEGLEMLQVCLASYRAVQGLDDPTTLGVLFELADSLVAQGAGQEARALLREDLEEREERLGPLDPAATGFLQRLASWYVGIEPEQAETLYRECLRRQELALGPSHPSTLRTMNALGVHLFDEDRYDEAATVFEVCADLRREVLGPNDPATLKTEANLIDTRRMQGRTAEAEMHFRQLIERTREVCGPTHDDTLSVMKKLVLLVDGEERLDEAIPLFEELLALQRQRSDRSGKTLLAMYDLAQRYRAAGRHEEALELSEEELEGWRNLVGDEDPNTVITMADLARYLLELGQPEEALLLLEECILATPEGPSLENRLDLLEQIRAALDEAEEGADPAGDGGSDGGATDDGASGGAR